MASSVDGLLEELMHVDWFASVGTPIVSPIETTRVSSWEEAFRWTEHSISWWCNVEGKKRLYEVLAVSHHDRFLEWNNVARSLLPRVQELIEKHVISHAPSGALPDQARGWIQSQILSALMELSYKDCIQVT